MARGLTEYKAPDGKPWKAADFENLVADIGLSLEDLADFHKAIHFNLAVWPIVCRLYGVHPLFPDAHTDPNYLRVWTREEICERDAMEPFELECHMEAVSGLWAQYRELNPRSEAPDRKPAETAIEVTPIRSESTTPESLNIEDVIRRFGFTLNIFDLPERHEELQEQEMAWFAARLLELKKMFDEPMAKSLARQAMINEMLMRRCDDTMTITAPSSKNFWSIQDTKLKIEEIYQKQWERLEEICPFIKNIEGKMNFTQCVSDLIKAYREYKANNNRRPIDGVFDQFEIQIEMRMSQQTPEPRYRPGWVAAVNEAKRCLWDPQFKRRLPDSICKSMDEGFAKAQLEMQEKGIIKLVDLERDDAAGEYPPLYTPEDDEIVVPEKSVDLD